MKEVVKFFYKRLKLDKQEKHKGRKLVNGYLAKYLFFTWLSNCLMFVKACNLFTLKQTREVQDSL